MDSSVWPFVARRVLGAVPLLLGVTLISFSLTVYFGPDKTWDLVGLNPTAAEVEQMREQLGYDRSFPERYVDFLLRLARLDLGHVEATGEAVTAVLARTIPVSLMVLLPGLVIGTVLALILAMLAAWHRSSRLDRMITGLSVTGMSLSFLVIIIGFQLIFGVWLGWFPVRGWVVDDVGDYLRHIAVPTMASVFVSLGYNTRFFRAVMVNELSSDQVMTARAFGAPPLSLMITNVLGNALLPILTRVMFSLPPILITGSLLIESHFSIPGVGRVTYEAILSGDQSVLMAVVSLSSILYVMVLTLTDLLGRWVDPRLRPR
jgi:peptide/nickel transport system permease protein